MGIRERQAKCSSCKVRWLWHVNQRGNPKVGGAHCPKCGASLQRTSHQWRGGKSQFIPRPATAEEARPLAKVAALVVAKQLGLETDATITTTGPRAVGYRQPKKAKIGAYPTVKP